MMSRRAPLLHQPIAICLPHKTIEQAISVDVTQLFPATEKTDPAKTMRAQSHSGEPLRIFFDGADCPQTGWTQQRRRQEQRRIKHLRRAGHFGEPSQMSDDERENHKSIIASAATGRSAAH